MTTRKKDLPKLRWKFLNYAREGLEMKILSLNTEFTQDRDRIALNVDQEITPEFLTVLERGTLSFAGSGTVLMVEKPGYDPSFSAEAIEEIQKRLDHAQNHLDEAVEKRHRMLNSLAKWTGLPLDSALTSQSHR